VGVIDVGEGGSIGDFVFGEGFSGLGGFDSSLVDMKSRCVTFKVPMYRGMNGKTTHHVSLLKQTIFGGRVWRGGIRSGRLISIS
jgi:hypothetical protein